MRRTLPFSSISCLASVSMTSFIDGSYSVWLNQRAVGRAFQPDVRTGLSCAKTIFLPPANRLVQTFAQSQTGTPVQFARQSAYIGQQMLRLRLRRGDCSEANQVAAV